MNTKNQQTKKCPYCAEDILSGAVKCKHCGEWVEKQIENFSSPGNVKQEKFSNMVPVNKFIFLSIVTFGIYELVWFYRNWNLLKKEKDLKILPFWRAFFAPLFAVSIASHLKKFLQEKNSSHNYSPWLIGIGYFVMAFLYKLPDPYWLISFFTFIPMLPLVSSMNMYWEKEEDNLSLKKYNWWQIILMVLSVVFIILSVIGTFISE